MYQVRETHPLREAVIHVQNTHSKTQANAYRQPLPKESSALEIFSVGGIVKSRFSNNSLSFWFLQAMVMLVVLVAGSEPCLGKEIKIGMSAAFTGPSRGLGIELYRGSMAYFSNVNEQGGVFGHKINVIAYDDGYNPVPTVSNTIQLG